MASDFAEYQEIFERVGALLKASVGFDLFTVSRLLSEGTEVERIFTTLPSAYPVGGRKPVDHSAWNETMARGECFVANTPQEFGEHFKDLAVIVALGFGAVINVPVHQGPRLMGTLNLLDKSGAYRGSVVDACQAVCQLAARGYTAYEQFLDKNRADQTN